MNHIIPHFKNMWMNYREILCGWTKIYIRLECDGLCLCVYLWMDVKMGMVKREKLGLVSLYGTSGFWHLMSNS